MNNLMQMPIIKQLDYQGKLHAQNLVNRGITLGALYFWFNLHTGSYKSFPQSVLEKDILHFCRKYPEFKNDFLNAIEK